MLRDYQQKASDAAFEYFTDKKAKYNAIMVLPTGCHARGTKILMYNGTLKKVEDIHEGDILIGDDGNPRKVLGTHHGIDKMYEITPIKGDSFVVNGGHILSLYKTSEGSKYQSELPRIDEISVEEYVTKSNNYKHLHKLYKPNFVNFIHLEDLIEPYFLGLYIGDGSSVCGSVNITTQRKETVAFLIDLAKKYNLKITKHQKKDNLASTYSLSNINPSRSKENPITSLLRSLDLNGVTCAFKFIPLPYKTASKKDRLEILAGLLDTDSYYDNKRNTFEYCSKSIQLSEDVVFLCRSLGLFAQIGKTKIVNGDKYYRIQISGDLDTIPTRVEIRKAKPRLQKKSVLVTGFDVKYMGKGNYYGFTIDGNHLYCDGQFFVHHNSGKSHIIADIATRLNAPVLIFQPSKEILEQNFAKMQAVNPFGCTIFSASFNSKEIGKITFATIGSVKNHPNLFEIFPYIIVDECFPYRQFISTEKGKMRIGYMFKLFNEGKELPRVLSYDEKSKNIIPNRIVSVRNNGIKDVFKLKFNECFSIKSTLNHPYLTTEGWKNAEQLNVGDAVLSAYSGGSHLKIPNQDQIDFILGSLVGDGSLDTTRKTINANRLRFIQGEKQKEYLRWKAMLLDREDKIQMIEHNGYAQKQAYRFCSEVMYLKDDMMTKKYAIKNLSLKSLAVIYMDDGSLSLDQNQATIYSVAESEELTSLFVSKLHELEIDCIASKCKSSSSHRICNYVRIRSQGVKVLCKLIAPYVHKSMKYKIIDEYKEFTGSYKWNGSYNKLGCNIFIGKEYCGKQEVYNMEVENAHTYIVTSSKYDKNYKDFDNGLIVHNCHGVNPKQGMYKDFFNAIGDTKILGLTATPYRLTQCMNGSMLKFITRTRPNVFSKVIYQVQIQTLLDMGYLAKLRYFQMNIVGWNENNLRVNSTGADYTDKSLIAEYERVGFYGFLVDIVKRLINPCGGRKPHGILVFTRFIKEALQLTQSIPGCEIVTGETPKKDRERILKAFKDGSIPVVANVGVLTCLSDDTEILTANGWANMGEIDMNTNVAQYDQTNGHISFANPQRVIKNEYFSENFVGLEGTYTNFLVTHNHKMLYAKRNHQGNVGEVKKCLASELVGKDVLIPVSGFADALPLKVSQKKRCSDKRFIASNSYNFRKKGMSPEDAKVKSLELLKRRNERLYKNPSELTIYECRFIGFWLGDGSKWLSKDGGIRYSLTQSLHTYKICEWIENVMNNNGINYTYHDYEGSTAKICGRLCKTNGYRTYSLAKGTGGDGQENESKLYSLIPYLKKEGTYLYWGLNREQYFGLMEGLFMADGNHGNGNKYTGQKIIGVYKELFDLLQAIGVCRGYRVSVMTVKDRDFTKNTLFNISLRDKQFHKLSHDIPKLLKNDKPKTVWCVTMPLGNIITRREGKVTIMGNCGFDYPELDTIVMARPTMSLAMYYQIVGRGIRPYKGKDGWFIDLCGNIERFGHVDDLRLENSGFGKWAVYSKGKQLTNVLFN